MQAEGGWSIPVFFSEQETRVPSSSVGEAPPTSRWGISMYKNVSSLQGTHATHPSLLLHGGWRSRWKRKANPTPSLLEHPPMNACAGPCLSGRPVSSAAQHTSSQRKAALVHFRSTYIVRGEPLGTPFHLTLGMGNSPLGPHGQGINSATRTPYSLQVCLRVPLSSPLLPQLGVCGRQRERHRPAQELQALWGGGYCLLEDAQFECEGS